MTSVPPLPVQGLAAASIYRVDGVRWAASQSTRRIAAHASVLILLVSYRRTTLAKRGEGMARFEDTQSPYLAAAIEDHINEEDSQTNALSGRPVYAEMTADSRFRESAADALPPLSLD